MVSFHYSGLRLHIFFLKTSVSSRNNEMCYLLLFEKLLQGLLTITKSTIMHLRCNSIQAMWVGSVSFDSANSI